MQSSATQRQNSGARTKGGSVLLSSTASSSQLTGTARSPGPQCRTRPQLPPGQDCLFSHTCWNSARFGRAELLEMWLLSAKRLEAVLLGHRERDAHKAPFLGLAVSKKLRSDGLSNSEGLIRPTLRSSYRSDDLNSSYRVCERDEQPYTS